MLNNKNKKDDFYGDINNRDHSEEISITILYIITMIFGSIFYDRVLIWTAATFIWFKYISRNWK